MNFLSLILQDSLVQITGVYIKNVRGTATTSSVVTMKCSRNVSCKHVELRDIDLVYNGTEPTTSICRNVNPVLLGALNPVMCGGSVEKPRFEMAAPAKAHPRDEPKAVQFLV